MSLVSSFAPYPDESGLGYYRRLASENMMWGWRDLAGAANKHATRESLLSRPEYISEFLGLELEWTQRSHEQEQQARTWRVFRRYSKFDAVCPCCVRETGYLRQGWGHAYVTCCSKHNVRLIDRCNSCGEQLTVNRDRIEVCTCGHDLRDSVTIAPTKAELWLSALIVSNGASSGKVLPKVQGADIYTLCLLVRDLCLMMDPNIPAPSRSAGTVRTVADAVVLLAPLDALLSDWPTNFRAHVSERIRVGRPGARTLNNLLGEWYIQLRKRCQGAALEPFLVTTLEIAAKEFDGVLGNDPSVYATAEEIKYLSLSAAARLIGVTRGHLSNAVLRGNIPSRCVLLGTRGKAYEVPKQDAERVAKERLNWLRGVEAAERAGVGETVMKSMAEAGVVNFDPQWRRDIFKAGEIEASSIDDLYAELVRKVNIVDKSDEELVFWSGLMSRSWGSNSAIQSVMQAAQRGELRAVVKGATIGKMGFLRSDVAQYFGAPVLESGMSLRHLSSMTGWNHESIRHWINAGLMQTVEVKLPGKQRDVILPEQLLAFRQTYVPLADLAKALNTKASALARNLGDAVEVIGALHLPNGLRRGGLLRVTDLGRLAVLQAKASRE